MCTRMSPPIFPRPYRDAKQRVCNLVPDISKFVSDNEYDIDMDTCRDLSRIAAEESFNLTLHTLLTSHAHNRTRISSHVLGLISPRIAGWWHFCSRRAPNTTHCGHGDFESLLDTHPGRRSRQPVECAVHYAQCEGRCNRTKGALDVTHEDDVQYGAVQCSRDPHVRLPAV
jgi:hypothetical protein